MYFSYIITTDVRECLYIYYLDRIDDMDDRLETVESWITDAEDKFSPQNVINLENSIKNLCENVNDLKLRLVELEKQLEELEEQVSKSFFQKLMFWR